MDLHETVPLLLRVPASHVSRHRGYMVHQSVGEEGWTVSVAAGVRVANFNNRARAERAMHRLSEVLDVDAWPTEDLHWVMVLWDRVDVGTRTAMRAVIDDARLR